MRTNRNLEPYRSGKFHVSDELTIDGVERGFHENFADSCKAFTVGKSLTKWGEDDNPVVAEPENMRFNYPKTYAAWKNIYDLVYE